MEFWLHVIRLETYFRWTWWGGHTGDDERARASIWKHRYEFGEV